MNPILRTASLATLMAFGMGGLGYASVPLYRMFCQVTGFGGTTQMKVGGQAPGAMAGKTMSVRFDANHTNDLPWTFKPEATKATVTLGEREMAFYVAKNLSDKPVTGSASYNVTPTSAGAYFTKIQCFCFNEQTLQPGQEVRMPVIYYVDPAILKDMDAREISEITLSYTFYPVDEPKKPS
jgi:cytochrome c oxidase assembly protein subunit 11